MASSSNDLSFRPYVERALSDCARELGWPGGAFPAVLTEIVTSLSRYREEGKRLFPVVFLTRDLEALLGQVGGRDPLTLGTGPMHPETIQRALKQCAPLGEGRSWVVFVVVAEDSLRFGVFRSSGTAIDPTALSRLRRSPRTASSPLGLVQVAENVVELRAGSDWHRMLHLSGAEVHDVSPRAVSRTFIEALTHDVPPELREPLGNLYYRVVMDVLQVWHGTLCAVLSAGAPLPEYLRDGVVLEQPVDLTADVRGLVERQDPDAAQALQALANLLRGMLSADGITVLRSDGRVLAYNVFISHPPTAARLGLGGARRRTFEVLRGEVGRTLAATFYRSQDGSACCESSFPPAPQR